MTREQKIDPADWPALLQKLKGELGALEEVDRQWLRDRLDAIASIQMDLDTLFRAAGGVRACAECDGACCGCGRHHVTLTNLLAYLLVDEEPPVPDPGKTCPYLAESGCRLPVARRPYNCITFFCEQIEENLSEEDRQQLRLLDRQLRQEYQAVVDRYPVASLRGLWIALGNLGDGQILISNR